ncbi:MAG: hypothetical protein HY077_00185 [Elusimicrobia bacterium]|nr:hypothetical protein [Elusimicrobiota bacterium]
MTRIKRIAARAALAAVSTASSLLLAEFSYRAYLRSHSYRSGVFELYVVGESSAYGRPYGPELAFPELVRQMFDGRLAGRPIVVHNLARPGDTLYPQTVPLLRALRVRNRSEPAAVLVYSGHNEYFQRPGEASPAARAYNALKLPVARWSLLAADLLCAVERRFALRGVRDFATYEYHLRRLIEESRRAGAVPILSTVIGNTAGIEPNVICEPGAGCASVRAAARRGLALEKAGRFEAALRAYREDLGEDDRRRALLEYLSARCRWAQGRTAEAHELFWSAVDDDPGGRFGRASRGLNGELKAAASRLGVPLVDAVALFESRSPGGTVGSELMSDGQHPNLRGNLLLAEGFSQALARAFGERTKRTVTPAAALRAASYGPERQAAALLESGRWLLMVSLDHPLPAGRLALALSRFQRAVELQPAAVEPRLGLGLTAAALRSESFDEARWGADVRRLLMPEGCARPEDLAAIIGRMERAGVDASSRRALERAPEGRCR